MSNKTVQYIERNDGELALHCWHTEFNPEAVIFYIHGMQSHAGWVKPTGEYLASGTTWVYVLDRRGSGLSGGLRGDILSLDTLLDDYYFILSLINKKHPHAKLVLIGQSLGGSILAGFLAWVKNNIIYDGVIFLSPALSQFHAKLKQEDREKYLLDKSLSLHKTNLLDENYTSDEYFLNFIRTDPLIIRHITKRSLSAYIELEGLYSHMSSYLSCKSLLLLPEDDPMMISKISKKTYLFITGNKGIVEVLPGNRHYLEFSFARNEVYRYINDFVCEVIKSDC